MTDLYGNVREQTNDELRRQLQHQLHLLQQHTTQTFHHLVSWLH